MPRSRLRRAAGARAALALAAALLVALVAALPATAAPARATAAAIAAGGGPGAPTGIASAAHPPAYQPRQVVVRFAADATRAQQAAVERRSHVQRVSTPMSGTAVVRILDHRSVRAAAAALRTDPLVDWAGPDAIAHASYIPNDPGLAHAPGGWQQLQWNLLPGTGVDAPGAWTNLLRAKRPGGRGVVVAVLDTGVAYRNHGRFRRAPDFVASQFVPGYDFVAHTKHPDDYYGHGTFVASLIAERTNNGRYLAGLAYGVKIMPVRVLDAKGLGRASTIAAGIRFAARHGAQVINLSLEFDDTSAGEIPELLSAIRFAHRRGVVIVAAAGNTAGRQLAYPARASTVISVGATTEHGCLANYSNTGHGLALVAPGGGADAALLADPTRCQPQGPAGRDIFAVTYTGSIRRFGLPGGYEGTSMAAPHVAATAALVIASGVLGKHPTPKAVRRQLERTAHPIGTAGYNTIYGYGLVDANAATTPPATAGRKTSAGTRAGTAKKRRQARKQGARAGGTRAGAR